MQQENGVGSGVCIESARLDEEIDQIVRETALREQIMTDALKIAGIRDRLEEVGLEKRSVGQRRYRNGKTLSEPLKGFGKAQMGQMDRQIDGAAAANATVPVHEFGAGDRENALGCMPLARVVAILLGAPGLEH